MFSQKPHAEDGTCHPGESSYPAREIMFIYYLFCFAKRVNHVPMAGNKNPKQPLGGHSTDHLPAIGSRFRIFLQLVAWRSLAARSPKPTAPSPKRQQGVGVGALGVK